jgi:hypothetical protein
MSRTQTIIAVAAAALLAPGIASAQDEAEVGDAGTGAGAEAAASDAGAEEPALEEPFVPDAPLFEDDGALPPPPVEVDDGKPFAKGDMEPGVGLGFMGYGDLFFMEIGGSFAYYVVNRFAPGLEVSYGTDFGSADIPDSVALLPFAKFVIIRSNRFAPYLIALGGREFEFNGYNAVHSWIVGGGVGMHIGIGAHVSIKVEVTFQHHWYDDPRIQGYEDARLYKDENGRKYPCFTDDACDMGEWYEATADNGDSCRCLDAQCIVYSCEVSDKKDLTHEWIIPIISFGMAFAF